MSTERHRGPRRGSQAKPDDQRASRGPGYRTTSRPVAPPAAGKGVLPGADNSGVRPLPTGVTGPAPNGLPTPAPARTLQEALHEAARSAGPRPPAPERGRPARPDPALSVDWSGAATYRASAPDRQRVASPLKQALVRAAEGPDAVPAPERRPSREPRVTPRSPATTGRPLIPGLRPPSAAPAGPAVSARAPRSTATTPQAYPRRGQVARPARPAAKPPTPLSHDAPAGSRPQLSGDAPWQKGETALIPLSELEARWSKAEPTSKPRGAATREWIALAIVVCGIIAGAGLWLRSRGVSVPSASTLTRALGLQQGSAATTPGQPPADTPAPMTVIDSLPHGAELHVDGVVVGNTPLTVVRGRRATTYELRLSGHRSQAVQVGPQSNARIVVSLQPTIAAPPSTTSGAN